MKALSKINKVKKIISKDDSLPELGSWFEYQFKDEKKLVCITHIGSNYLKVETISIKGCYSYDRIHFNEIDTKLTSIKDPLSYIQSKINLYQGKVKQLLFDVKKLTQSLGLQSINKIEDISEPQNKDLICISDQTNIKQYKSALHKAKEEQLPKMFKQIKRNSELLSAWMSAETLPMKAMVSSMENSIDKVDERIFKISLYAGLIENIKNCREGKPASINTKLHIMQRRLYMDEECLLGYRHGGMEFNDIKKFDKWISEDKNFKRILPFPRTIVAMKVRRYAKKRMSDGMLSTAFINFNLEQADKITFLYIRNGNNLYRLNTDLDFSEFIFPNKEEFDLAAPMMLKKSMARSGKIITIHNYEEKVKHFNENKRLSQQWEKDNKDKCWIHNPHRHHMSFNPNNWELFNSDSTYYDDTMKTIHNRINQYNRIVLIIQGLFDRSEILHPHPPVKTWDQNSFIKHIKLHYDGSESLYGTLEKPDFEKYFKKLNDLLTKDSYTIGQHKFWSAKEAEKENNRRARNWRNDSSYDLEYFEPYGNPGPGYIAKPTILRKKDATYNWYRERMRIDYYKDDKIKAVVRVPKELLFNVSEYKIGDYIKFFQDPRTREEYLKWAPMLLAAEEFHCKN